MSREMAFQKIMQEANRKTISQMKSLDGEIAVPLSSIEKAKETALLNDMKAELTRKTIEQTAALSVTVKYFAQFVPEIQSELQEMVHSYARIGIEQIENER